MQLQDIVNHSEIPVSPAPCQSSLPMHQQESLEDIPADPIPLSNDISVGLRSTVDELRKTVHFINALHDATLKQSNMQQEDIDRLCAAKPDPCYDVMDKHFLKAFRVFLSTTNASQATYDGVRSSMLDCYPDYPFLSFGQMKRHVEQLSGTVPISYNMCPDTCVGFTGPLADCELCPMCEKGRYQIEMQDPVRQFITIPLGPVIQALYGSVDTTEKMHYCKQATADIIRYA